jgi:hypothetical protein
VIAVRKGEVRSREENEGRECTANLLSEQAAASAENTEAAKIAVLNNSIRMYYFALYVLFRNGVKFGFSLCFECP